MNKINSPMSLNHVPLSPQSSPAPVRPAMASQTLTPLIPPGASHAGDAAVVSGQLVVPQSRLALFERAFGHVQQMLTEHRQAGSEPSTHSPSGLTGKELQESVAAAQWVSECLMPLGAR